MLKAHLCAFYVILNNRNKVFGLEAFAKSVTITVLNAPLNDYAWTLIDYAWTLVDYAWTKAVLTKQNYKISSPKVSWDCLRLL